MIKRLVGHLQFMVGQNHDLVNLTFNLTFNFKYIHIYIYIYIDEIITYEMRNETLRFDTKVSCLTEIFSQKIVTYNK